MIMLIHLNSKNTFMYWIHTHISSCLSNPSKQYSSNKLEKSCAIPFLNAKCSIPNELSHNRGHRIPFLSHFFLKDNVPLLQMLYRLLR